MVQDWWWKSLRRMARAISKRIASDHASDARSICGKIGGCKRRKHARAPRIVTQMTIAWTWTAAKQEAFGGWLEERMHRRVLWTKGGDESVHRSEWAFFCILSCLGVLAPHAICQGLKWINWSCVFKNPWIRNNMRIGWWYFFRAFWSKLLPSSLPVGPS